MATSNANYLQNPNKLSTKVTYAPGGASSLSLAWDNSPVNHNIRQKSHSYQPAPQYQKIEEENIYSQQQLSSPKSYYQPKNQGYINMSESNRLLQQQLHYYQQRNKMLRENIFGAYDNLDQINKFSAKNPQYGGYNTNQNNYFSKAEPYPYSPYYNQNPSKYRESDEQLDLAVMEQDRRRGQLRIQTESPYNQQYNSRVMNLSPHGQDKTSVKVSHPPGGRSSIVFG